MPNPRKRHYILLVSREDDGTLHKVPVPLRYAWLLAGAAAVGLFTLVGLAGSYTRMLIKTERFNQLRADHDNLRRDYASLERQARQKDVQAASLGSLAGEVSALYGLTAGRLTLHGGGVRVKDAAGKSPLADVSATDPGGNYYKSLDSFYALRHDALAGNLAPLSAAPLSFDHLRNPLLPGHDLSLGDGPDLASAYAPTLWPVTGPISSSFGEREDPVLGGGEGEFHPGLDISGPFGTPIHATADGTVTEAGMVNGYGRMVAIDHGHGVSTRYGHMSGFAVSAGQTVSRGEIIGFIGHSGKATGNHVHYEVRINGTPVNPHKYLRVTLAQFGAETVTPGL